MYINILITPMFPLFRVQILHARYDFPSPWWDNISGDAKDLVIHNMHRRLIYKERASTHAEGAYRVDYQTKP